MKITMLGTGAADGWPTPFCVCASCNGQRERGEIRGQTSALIDDRVLIDPGPEAPRSAVRAGLDLRHVALVLFTHGHPDHCHPQILLWRRWANLTSPITIAGPADALATCRDWVGADDPVHWVELRPGQKLKHDDLTVRALPATHTLGAVLYDLEDSTSRLLYATDTGPLSEACLAATQDRCYDTVLLELTWGRDTGRDRHHHDAASFPATIQSLRARGALSNTSDVVAIHLGHGNPPEPELSRMLRCWGARPARDHEVLHSGEPTANVPPHPQRTLVIGGARSGKSREAEQRVAADPHVTYVATGIGHDDDEQWRARVDRHQQRRPAHWTTVETADVVSVLRGAAQGETVLIDCLTLWLTTVLDQAGAWASDSAIEAVTHTACDALSEALKQCPAKVVLVTNEIGQGVVPPHASGRAFRDALGTVNARVATECDHVLVVTAGRVQSW